MPQMKHPKSTQVIDVAEGSVRTYHQQGWRLVDADVDHVEVPDPNPAGGSPPTGNVEGLDLDGSNPPADPNPGDHNPDPAQTGE